MLAANAAGGDAAKSPETVRINVSDAFVAYQRLN